MRRFSIGSLMVLTLVIAVAVAALRDASDTWAGILFGITLFLLASSLLGVIHRRDAKRAGWQGFALFGWGYLALAMAPGLDPAKLATTQLLDALHAKLTADSVQHTTYSNTPFKITFLAGTRPNTFALAPGSPTDATNTLQANRTFIWFSIPG